jgi:hypothetical protein
MRVPNRRQRKGKESGHAPWLTTLERGRGACSNSGMGLGKETSNLITHLNLHQTNQHVG